MGRTSDRPATRRQDAASVGVGAWLVGALFSDGWAHHNVPELESFFTPWHAALYSGLLAAGAWMAWLGRSGGRRWYAAVPAGYAWGVRGLAVFVLGGLADMAWHTALGVEAGIDALLSPPHLVLLAGGLLVLASPVRSRWLAGDWTSLPARLALVLATTLPAFFLLYVSAFTSAAPAVPFERLPEAHPDHVTAELPATHGVGSILLTTLVLLYPLLLVWRRRVLPPGQVTLLVAVVALLSSAVVDFAPVQVGAALGATAGAVLTDLSVPRVAARLADREGGLLPALAALAAGLLWSGYLVGIAVVGTIVWPVELWTGSVVLAMLAAAALAALAGMAPGQAVPDGEAAVPSGEPTVSGR